MALISLDKLQQVLTEYINTYIMPVAPSNYKWLLGGGTFAFKYLYQPLLEKYTPMLKSIGILNPNKQIDIELVKGFLNSAFEQSPTVDIKGFIFNKADGDALVQLLEKHKDT